MAIADFIYADPRLSQIICESLSGKFNMLEVYLKVTDPDQAIETVRSALADHWLLPLMEVRRQPMDKSV